MPTRPWLPTDLGTACIAWWNAQQNVTQTGGTVTQWVDVVAGIVATGTSGSQPTYSATARNGTPGLSFSGTQYLTFPTTAMPQGSAASTIAVGAYSSTNANSIAFGYGTAAGSQYRGVGEAAGGPVQAITFSNDYTTGPTFVSVDRFVTFEIPAGASPAFTVTTDGVPTTTAAKSTLNTNGATGYIGTFVPATARWTGSVQQIVVVNRVLTTAERQQLEGWESWYDGKAGANLPSGHPYKTAAPTVTTGGATDYPASLADTGSIGDAQSAVAAVPQSVADTGAISDTPAATASASQALSDTGAASDTTSATAAASGSVTDAGAVTDTVTGSSANTGALTDIGAASDTVTARAAASGALSDTGAITDSIASRAASSATLSDTGSVGDAIAGSAGGAVPAVVYYGLSNRTIAATDTVVGTVQKTTTPAPAYALSNKTQSPSYTSGASAPTVSASTSGATNQNVALSDTGAISDQVGYVGQPVVPVTPPWVQPISPPGGGGTTPRGSGYSSYDPELHRRREREEEEEEERRRRPKPAAVLVEAAVLPALGAPLALDALVPPMLPPGVALGSIPDLPLPVDPAADLLADDEEAIALLLAA